MAKNLVIVESPAKAKTISKYLGKDFEVKASYGHIRDLKKDDKAVLIEKNFQPIYEIPEDKLDTVKELKKLAEKSETIWLASDEDREGEAISWHLSEVLELPENKTKRIVFHEITEKAIKHAIRHPRSINMDLVNAQQARRILDRLVGYGISPILWKKIKNNLSAGRVQSVAVRLLVEREREIMHFQPETFYKISAIFQSANKNFKAELQHKYKKTGEVKSFLDFCKNASFIVQSVEVKPTKRSPSAPFTTSTLQQEASRKLGYSVAQTMRLAQSLYENGHITYMRTDSVNLSDFAIEAIQNTIEKQFGKKYHQKRHYKNKIINAQEAHEAIRPTDFNQIVVSEDSKEQKLYELIWKRAVASQMADAQLEKTVAKISIIKNQQTHEHNFVATGEVIKFEGFLKLYIESLDEEEHDENEENSQAILPPLEPNQKINNLEITALERQTKAPSRYTEASLVKKLEENGIGRPSTYAPTISTIQQRGYVVKENREGTEKLYKLFILKDGKILEQTKKEIIGIEKNKLFPTDLGIIVTDFLTKYFEDIVDYQFTAKVEHEFDEISLGKLNWVQMLHSFYDPFQGKLKKVETEAERVNNERVLGNDPLTGKIVIARMGRYGPLVQIGENEDEDKKFASLQPDQRIESITLEDALALFQLPRTLGEINGLPVSVNRGRFGPYILFDKKFYSVPKDYDLFTMTLEQAQNIIQNKIEADQKKHIATFSWNNKEIKILNGRWGPFISYNDENYKIPKNTDAYSLTLEDCLKIIESESPTKKTSKSAAKNTSKTNSTKKKK
ncbi:MAG: DNA topoisomerase 1 [Bacteroidia bacterium]|nr:MAG: DNA topoisomerase 1 [Bacteroidia bacterium]